MYINSRSNIITVDLGEIRAGFHRIAEAIMELPAQTLSETLTANLEHYARDNTEIFVFFLYMASERAKLRADMNTCKLCMEILNYEKERKPSIDNCCILTDYVESYIENNNLEESDSEWLKNSVKTAIVSEMPDYYVNISIYRNLLVIYRMLSGRKEVYDLLDYIRDNGDALDPEVKAYLLAS